jgi:aryl-alcohol dehydrogenase-like predicted oxidoreductase
VSLEDSLGALAELRDQGLIRRIGLSGANPGQLRRARAMTPIAAVQNRYNLLDGSGVEVLADPWAAAEDQKAASPDVGELQPKRNQNRVTE